MRPLLSGTHRVAAWLLPHRLMLALGFPLGVAVLCLSPPFQVPDEMVHFYRAYQISEGGFVAQEVPGSTGGALPTSLAQTVNSLVLDGDIRGHRELKIPRAPLRASFAIALSPKLREPVAFPGGVLYTPIVYFPQSVAMAIGRSLLLAPVVLMYFGRVGNLLLSLAILAWAIRLAPFQQWSLVAISLSPMVVFTRSSLSADALTFSCALLAVSLIAREVVETGLVSRTRFALLASVFAVLGLCKSTYFLLAFAIVLVPAQRFGGKLNHLVTSGALVATAIGPAAAWTRWVGHLFRSINPGANPAQQSAFVLDHPLYALSVWLSASWSFGDFYLRSAMGVLGWLDTPLPDWVLILLWLSLALVAISQASPVSIAQRVLAVGIVAANSLCVIAALYLAWTPVGADHVEGVQGRYFLPLLPLLLLTMGRRIAARQWQLGAATAFFLALSTSATLVALALRYW